MFGVAGNCWFEVDAVVAHDKGEISKESGRWGNGGMGNGAVGDAGYLAFSQSMWSPTPHQSTPKSTGQDRPEESSETALAPVNPTNPADALNPGYTSADNGQVIPPSLTQPPCEVVSRITELREYIFALLIPTDYSPYLLHLPRGTGHDLSTLMRVCWDFFYTAVLNFRVVYWPYTFSLHLYCSFPSGHFWILLLRSTLFRIPMDISRYL
ncbi:hypothetical protein C8Q78DRAFT_1080572 [Trametes maxima]|nr:hypothetical protein C8Q78DRAFT_1080572 [Trametes maxima]